MGNEFSIDVEVDAKIGAAAEDDDLTQTVNYGTIYQLLRVEMRQPTHLLEALAYRMAARIADQFDNVLHVKLRLHKLHPPLGGKVGASWVEVEVASPDGFSNLTGLNDARTFDDYTPHFDLDGPFASRDGGRAVTGAPHHPRPVPPAPALPQDRRLGELFSEHTDGHAVSDEDSGVRPFESDEDI